MQDPVPLDQFDDWVQCKVPGVKADLSGEGRGFVFGKPHLRFCCHSRLQICMPDLSLTLPECSRQPDGRREGGRLVPHPAGRRRRGAARLASRGGVGRGAQPPDGRHPACGR